MSFDPRCRQFGVIKISDDKRTVRLYFDNNNWRSIWVSGGEVASAMWAGDCVVVTLVNGRVLRYTDLNNFSSI